MNNEKKISFRTIPHLNGEVLFMGLKAGELSLSIILLLFLFFIFQFYVIPIIIAFGVLLGKTSKIQRKTKRSAFEMMMQGSNKSYKDETLILENLKSKSHENP